MARSFCIDPSDREKSLLLAIARKSIEQGIDTRVPLEVADSLMAGVLAQKAGSFVTLSLRGELRGCIGSLEPVQLLAQSVATNAFKAAFQDRRFQPLNRRDISQTYIDVAILSPPEPMPVSSHDELLQALRPGKDGLILEDGPHRATFLPKVWERLTDPREFVAHLMNKAGLPATHWSDTLRFSRYLTVSFAEDASATV